MKKLLFVLTVLLTFCSCAKNYPQLVKDKAEQYKKEGKIILNQSNDSTGKEHYIVYADVKAQVIGVDTLGEKVKEIKLGKKKYKQLDLCVEEGIGLVAKFCEGTLQPKEYKVQANGQFLADGQPTSVKMYKDKYILVKWVDIDFINDVIFIDGEEDAYYQLFGTFATDDSGNLNVLVTTSLTFVLPDSWNEFVTDPYDHPDLYIDSDGGNLVCKTTVSPDGKILKQSDVAACDQIQIPTEAFSSWDMLIPYIYKIVARRMSLNLME